MDKEANLRKLRESTHSRFDEMDKEAEERKLCVINKRLLTVSHC
ncbi:4565_t:CDS:1, partial [Funneliformis geosporum]